MFPSVPTIRTTIAELRFRPILVALALMPCVTALLAASGIDAAANRFAQGAMPLWLSVVWSAPALILGLVAPILIPLLAGLLPQTRAHAPRLWLALGLSLALVSVLKTLTGRIHPEALVPADLYARSLGFTLLGGELVEGWPSGHAATNGAVALVLAQASPSPTIRRLSIAWLVWVWAAVVLGINGQVHWLSDMVAGALLAAATARSLSTPER